MARMYIDMTNKKIQTFTFIKPLYSKHNKTIWLCKCDCGVEKEINAHDARRNKIGKCKCQNKVKKDIIVEKHLYKTRKRNRLYVIWCNMKSRCNNKNAKSYARYGMRNIKICDDWNFSYSNFEQWALSNGYNDNLTIERINNNDGYNPNNCKFATYSEQNKNKNNTIIIFENDNKMCLKDFCEKYNFNYATITQRIRNGSSVQNAIFQGGGK